ncbi:alpha/beta hydrolase [Salipiger mangrovisoli]|uniref:Alpha/beta hydrolase n=1 Tax=Salipiger mangrovisoli TaxID=2865933 RepID=A0ABR9X5N2_9RHOB|nr:alpha/beta hydrolase [Salipiger mangrovisoli]MBE9638756.1 alpha/beta hydrolase [Salipiger mangrovisoli]
MTTRRSFLAGSAVAALGAAVPPRAYAEFSPAGPAVDVVQSTYDLVSPDLRLLADVSPFDITAETLPQLRAAVDANGAARAMPDKAEIVDVPGSPASFRLFRPELTPEGPVPCILFIHGGGMILNQAQSFDALCHDFAQRTGALVANAEYRLAPEAPFPGPVEDCYAVLSYLHDNAASLGIDPLRISVMGQSAGGGLAAALAILARDRGDVPVRAQFLIYPMLDYRTGTTAAPVNNLTTGEFVWTRANTRFGWDALRGDYQLDDGRIGQFSPSHVPSTAGLPAAFVAVGDLDLFLEEDTAYVLRMVRERVPCELHIYAGAPHGFDMVPGAASAKAHDANLNAAFSRLL